MIMRPRVGRPRREGRAKREAKTERGVANAKRKGRLFRRMNRARAAKRAFTARKRAGMASRVGRAGRAGFTAARTVGGAAARAGARAAVANPVGLVIAGLVIGGAIAARLVTGRSFENMGENIKSMLLGDLSEEAVAKRDTRMAMSSDAELARIVGQEGRVNSQIISIGRDLKAIRKRDLDGSAAFKKDRDFQNNGTIFDQLIIRARDKLVASFKDEGGMDAVERFRRKYKGAVQSAEKSGAR